MPARRKRPYHHGNLRESLLDAAEAALAQLPVERLSLREIARRAGVSHAAPAHHFGSLGVLFAEVAARGFERFVAVLEEAARQVEPSPPARLRAMARAYLGFAEGNPAAYGLMFGKRDNVVATPHLMEAMQAAWSQLENAVRDIVGPERALYGASTVWSAVHGLAMLELDRKLPPHIDRSLAAEKLAHVIVAGLQSELGS
jgi:AcrR family transcriptional regulator